MAVWSSVAQHCKTLPNTAKHRTTLHNTAHHCTTLPKTAKHCKALRHSWCSVLSYFAVVCGSNWWELVEREQQRTTENDRERQRDKEKGRPEDRETERGRERERDREREKREKTWGTEITLSRVCKLSLSRSCFRFRSLARSLTRFCLILLSLSVLSLSFYLSC